jgi:hypothetical protein
MLKVGVWILGTEVLMAFAACSSGNSGGDTGAMFGDDGGSGGDVTTSSGGSSSSGGRSSSGVTDSGSSSGGSSSSTSSGGGLDSGVEEQACTDLVTAGCNRLNECAPYGLIAVFGDMNTCIARGKLACPSLFHAPGTGGSPMAAEACVAATMSISCQDLLDNVPASACVFHGTRPLGASCGADADCSANAYCDFSSGKVCGVCTARLASGGTCVGDSYCQTGLVCGKSTNNNATTGTCIAPGDQGAKCDSTHPCLATLGCSAAGTCGSYLQLGASCTAQNCDLLHGLYCDPVKHVCIQSHTASAGATCGYAMGAYSICTSSDSCVLASSTAISGTCLAAAGDGKSCNVSNGPECLLPAFCVGGVCTMPSTTCH